MAVGFILGGPMIGYDDRAEECEGWFEGMEIHGFTSSGLFLAPGKLPRRFEVVRYPTLAFGHRYNLQTGQGLMVKKQFDAAATDPTLFKEDLSGGLVCDCEPPAAALAHSCRFRLLSTFVFPFLFSPSDEAKAPAEKEQWELRLKARVRAESLQTNVWYPVELAPEGTEIVYNHYGETPGLFYGAFRLANMGPDGQGEGELRFVDLGDWDRTVRRVRLYRYGRPIGEAEWDD